MGTDARTLLAEILEKYNGKMAALPADAGPFRFAALFTGLANELHSRFAAADPVVAPAKPAADGKVRRLVAEAPPYNGKDRRHLLEDLDKMLAYTEDGKAVPLGKLPANEFLKVIGGAMTAFSHFLENVRVPPTQQSVVDGAQEAVEKAMLFLGRRAAELNAVEVRGGLLVEARLLAGEARRRAAAPEDDEAEEPPELSRRRGGCASPPEEKNYKTMEDVPEEEIMSCPLPDAPARRTLTVVEGPGPAEDALQEPDPVIEAPPPVSAVKAKSPRSWSEQRRAKFAAYKQTPEYEAYCRRMAVGATLRHERAGNGKRGAKKQVFASGPAA